MRPHAGPAVAPGAGPAPVPGAGAGAEVALAVEEISRFYAEWARSNHPGFVEAVVADARVAMALKGEPLDGASRLATARAVVQLTCTADAFVGLLLYRAKAALRARRVPVIPAVLHRLAMVLAQVSIGDSAVIRPGISLPHGQVVIDGIVEVGSGAVIRPWVTIGLKEGVFCGPTIGPGVTIGTGAKLIGPISVGRGARIGANAVVIRDVPEGAIVAGVPAHPLRR